jgi:hypothetical protein
MLSRLIGRGVLIGAVVGICLPPVYGLTIRADRPDSDYINLGATVVPQAGWVEGNGWIGSGTLISPTWVLTAGHVASGTATNFNSPAGYRTVINQYEYGNGIDVGLVQLSSPITNVKPVPLYSVDSFGIEDGQTAIIAGAGNTGTGLTGEQGGTSGGFRAGDSRVYANASQWTWPSSELLTWFLSPSEGGADLEAGSASGDSGGGLFLNVDGTWAIAAVQSQAWWVTGTSSIGTYDSGGIYARTGTDPLLKWIMSYATDAHVVPEPTALSLFGLMGLILVRRKRGE